MKDSYCWTFAPATPTPTKSRSAVFSYKSVKLLYADLDPKLSYVLALTYASDHVYKRVQSLWADGVELHEPFRPAPGGGRAGRGPRARERRRRRAMALQLRIHGEVNATVSIVELWANAPPQADVLRDGDGVGACPDLTGQVLDMAYEPAAGATVEMLAPAGGVAVGHRDDGQRWSFRLPRKAFDDAQRRAGCGSSSAAVRPRTRIAAADSSFQPVRYRPLPAQVDRPGVQAVSLDGTWKIDPRPPTTRNRPLDAAEWKDFKCPASGGSRASTYRKTNRRHGEGVRGAAGMGRTAASSCGSTRSTPARATGSTANRSATARTCSRPSSGRSPPRSGPATQTASTWK